MEQPSAHVLEFGPYRIDREQSLLTKESSIVPLAPKVFDLLLALVERSGRTVGKELLLKQLWPDSFVEEGSLTRNISTLRKVLGEGADDQKYILTVPKRGYRFGAEVRSVPAANVPASTVTPEAYDCYLRGRFYARRQNKADNEAAMSALESAAAIDPTFAPAWAELAQTYIWKLFLFAPHERQWEEKAFMAVEKALSLDPNLAVAYLARGRLLWTPANHFPHAKAIREYRRALALNPNLDEARNQLALIYCHIGYFEDALRESEEAILANPNNHLAVYRTAQTLVFQGKHRQALAVLKTVPNDVNPSLIGYQTAWILFNLGRNEEASATIDLLICGYPEDDGALFTSMQAVLAASAGDASQAHAKIELSIRTGKGFGHFHHAAYHIAVAFGLMHKAEQAVEWLEFAAADGFPCFPLFESDSNLKSLCGNARYIAFMAILKEQWMEYRPIFETPEGTSPTLPRGAR